MFLAVALAFLIIRYARRTLQTAKLYPELDGLLKMGVWAAIAIILTDFIVPGGKHIAVWLADALLIGLLYLAIQRIEFRPVKSMINAVLPLVIVLIIDNLIEKISPSFYYRWNDLFDTAKVFAIIWLFAMWMVTRKQRKALEKEKLKAEEKEKEFKITEALKSELEVQVAERTAALTLQKEELQQTITELKSTQAQLIQSEKMASLGELTAGIAHEIQNPLNFVNNFSEVNAELLTEMQEIIDQGNWPEVKSIAADIAENEKKIIHHGKRADAIVKGMLQHSRSSSSVKEPTDLNELADEYLRLAYHGLRAKDKSFNATMKTDFDQHIGMVSIVPQEIGRVILNLITNSFYAVNEKNNSGLTGYSPTVFLSTKKILTTPGTGRIEIAVKDNGNGIPQHVMDKIFQPFFTTKPTGQGTGLGLSLSYDIIKAHGGKIRAKTTIGESTTFTVELPITQ